MDDTHRAERNADRLQQLYTTFRARVQRVVRDLEALGRRPRIQDAWRSPEAQRAAFKAGHSKLLFGFHNVSGSDGSPQALAVDLLDDNAPTAPGRPYLLQLAACAEAHGLLSGIRWGLPTALAEAIDAAIAAQDWKADVKIGWDPTHLEPRGFTVLQAKQGQRPH